MLGEGRQWFDRYLRGEQNGIDKKPPVEVAPVAWKRKTRGYAAPSAIVNAGAGSGVDVFGPGKSHGTTIASSGRVVVSYPTPPGARAADVFGSPSIKITATATGGWSRLVAILTAKTKDGRTIVISGGGVPTIQGKHTYTIRMINQMTLIPAGATLSITLGSSSLAQDPGDLLYLQLPMPAAARLNVGNRVSLNLPEVLPGY
jgi:hypothetical protein